LALLELFGSLAELANSWGRELLHGLIVNSKKNFRVCR